MKILVFVLATSLSLALCCNLSAQFVDGEWTVTSGEFSGQAVDKADLEKMSLSLNSNSFEAKSGDLVSKGLLNVSARSRPSQIVFMINEGADSGRTVNAIYELKRSVLKIAFSQNEEFPTDFESNVDNGVLLLTYKGNSNNVGLNRGGRRGPLPQLGEPEVIGMGGNKK